MLVIIYIWWLNFAFKKQAFLLRKKKECVLYIVKNGAYLVR